MDLDFKIIDGDTHYYETPDCFTRNIDPRFRDDAVKVEMHPDGNATITFRDTPLELMPPNFFTVAPRPGGLQDMMRAAKAGRTLEEARVFVPMADEWVDRDARLKTMDAHGVEASLLYPTLGILVEHHLRNDVDALYANLHSFNRWVEDDWGFNYQDRIFGAPQLSLADPDRAVEELEWVLERGARVAFMRPGHAHHRSPADPIFDPFWARVNESGIVISFHMAESGYNEFYSVDMGEDPTPLPHAKSALQWTLFYGDRPIMDTFGSLILHNLFGRFPNVRVYSVENGSLWVAYLLAQMDKMKGMGNTGPWRGGRVEGRPSDIFRRHVMVSPFPEDDVAALIELLGEDAVVMGSDYPHAEGTSEPGRMAEAVKDLGPTVQRKFMRDNALRLLAAPVAS